MIISFLDLSVVFASPPKPTGDLIYTPLWALCTWPCLMHVLRLLAAHLLLAWYAARVCPVHARQLSNMPVRLWKCRHFVNPSEKPDRNLYRLCDSGVVLRYSDAFINSGVASYGALGYVPPSLDFQHFILVHFEVDLWQPTIKVLCSLRDQLMQMSTTHSFSISTALVTKLLVIEQSAAPGPEARRKCPITISSFAPPRNKSWRRHCLLT